MLMDAYCVHIGVKYEYVKSTWSILIVVQCRFKKLGADANVYRTRPQRSEEKCFLYVYLIEYTHCDFR